MKKLWKIPIGTYGYRSPGVIRKKCFYFADIWASVLTLYYMVTGWHLFDNDKKIDNLNKFIAVTSFEDFVLYVLKTIRMKSEINEQSLELSHVWLNDNLCDEKVLKF